MAEKGADESTKLAEQVIALIQSKFPGGVEYGAVELGDAVVRIKKEDVKPFFSFLRDDSSLRFDLLLSLTAVDYLPLEGDKNVKERYEAVYHLLSLPNRYRLRVKVWVAEEDASIDSISDLWAAANFMEREAWGYVRCKICRTPGP
jgi:NADH:ubiquinone oxidoreductase subunit C